MTRLAEVYARIPEVHCKGLCHNACGPIPMSRSELVQLRVAAGRRVRADDYGGDDVLLRTGEDRRCLLLKKGRCSAYTGRPLICRVYGAAEGLECPYGCRPDGPLLTKPEVYELVAAARGARP